MCIRDRFREEDQVFIPNTYPSEQISVGSCNGDFSLEDILINVPKALKEFLNIKKTSKQILLNLFGQYEIKIFDEINLNNNCQCSNQKVLNTLKLMDQKEIIFLFNNKKTIEVVCEFCKTKRVYSEQDLK